MAPRQTVNGLPAVKYQTSVTPMGSQVVAGVRDALWRKGLGRGDGGGLRHRRRVA